MRVKVGGIRNKEDFVSKVEEAVKGLFSTELIITRVWKEISIYQINVKKYVCLFLEKSPGQWILGGGWNIDLWGGGYPEASWLDGISAQNPVCL